MNKVGCKHCQITAESHWWWYHYQLQKWIFNKNMTFQLWAEQKYFSQTMYSRFILSMLSIKKYKLCITKDQFVKQIFHQWTWVTLALPRAALPWTGGPWQNMQKVEPCQNCAKIYGKKRRPPANYPTLFWDNFWAFALQHPKPGVSNICVQPFTFLSRSEVVTSVYLLLWMSNQLQRSKVQCLECPFEISSIKVDAPLYIGGGLDLIWDLSGS